MTLNESKTTFSLITSNAIVVAKNGQTLGIGAGQMNRVGAAKLALGIDVPLACMSSRYSVMARITILRTSGFDPAFEETQIKIGRRLAIKVLNASKFALSMGVPWDADEAALAAVPAPSLDAREVTEDIDRALLAALAEVVEAATTAFEGYEHARALEVTESLF